jgi:hypothetical protein
MKVVNAYHVHVATTPRTSRLFWTRSDVNSIFLQVYEKYSKDAFGALLDVYSEYEHPMVYFFCLAARRDHDSGNTSSESLVPCRHVIIDTSVPFSIQEVDVGNSPESCNVN